MGDKLKGNVTVGHETTVGRQRGTRRVGGRRLVSASAAIAICGPTADPNPQSGLAGQHTARN